MREVVFNRSFFGGLEHGAVCRALNFNFRQIVAVNAICRIVAAVVTPQRRQVRRYCIAQGIVRDEYFEVRCPFLNPLLPLFSACCRAPRVRIKDGTLEQTEEGAATSYAVEGAPLYASSRRASL